MRAIDIDYIYGRLKNQKMTESIRPGDTDEAYYQCGWNNALCRVDMILAGTPTLDVEPVRHGRWIWSAENGWTCSNCKFDCWHYSERFDPYAPLPDAEYCPKCGAKMDLPNQ